MAAVSDSSPLILFGRIGQLDLIRAVFGDVFVPPAAWREVVIDGAEKSGSMEVANASWIHQRPLPEFTFPRRVSALHRGESEAITLAASHKPPLAVLLDDSDARRVAEEMALVVVGCGGLLVLAKNQGYLAAVALLLDDLQAAGLFLGRSAASRILERAGEH
jgi:predicted nucleic acid-binding protein